MKIRHITETTAGATASGSVASVAKPMGEVQSRMQAPPKSPKVKKPKKNTYKNQISESEMKEEKISEQDLIIVPGMRKSKDTSFIPHEKDRRDHEVEMARSDLAAAAKDAMRIHKILKGRSEEQGLMGWQQSYITLASDYLNSVADSLEHQVSNEMTAGVLAGGMSNFEEAEKPGLWANIHAKRERIKKGSGERMRKPGSKGAPTAQAFKQSQKTSKKK